MSYSKQFTIDDAFEDEPFDEIKVYGSNNIRNSPLQSPGQSKFSNYGGIVHDSVANTKAFEDTISRDSDSLIHNSAPTCPSKSRGCWHHPQVRENWRVVLAAILLLVLGTVLLLVATAVQLTPNSNYNAAVFFIAGFICFIPGAYHVIYIYLAAKGCAGYSFYSLSLFN
ncbi:transmembrane protein 134 [Adelges cooleyi]|uniref:transmembrane protein 134 n=1 Tax=Adelges cooleyi TaxID=133065 RepID=UPI00217FB1ED|nr:transmembrane protein 134 [Adelges cooleyi]